MIQMQKYSISGVFALIFFSSCLRSTPNPVTEIVGSAAPANEAVSFMEDLQPISFQLLGTPAQYRNVGYHSALRDLQRWHDRIYLARCDWYANTGPLKLSCYEIHKRFARISAKIQTTPGCHLQPGRSCDQPQMPLACRVKYHLSDDEVLCLKARGLDIYSS